MNLHGVLNCTFSPVRKISYSVRNRQRNFKILLAMCLCFVILNCFYCYELFSVGTGKNSLKTYIYRPLSRSLDLQYPACMESSTRVMEQTFIYLSSVQLPVETQEFTAMLRIQISSDPKLCICQETDPHLHPT